MANLSQAMFWLSKGKKVRSKGWASGIHLYMKGDQIVAHRGVVCFPDVDDWELYEEEEADEKEDTCCLSERVDDLEQAVNVLGVQMDAVIKALRR